MTTMTAAEILRDLQALGTEPYRRVLLRHGIREPVFGVKVAELKKIQKRVKKDHRLALDLYDTGVYDARYLAGLIADERRVTAAELRHWAESTDCVALCGTAVAWVASESPHGWGLALEWIDSGRETLAVTGWHTLGSVVAVKSDADLDLVGLERLLRRVGETIHGQADRVRYGMNGFVIAVGTYVRPLAALAMEVAERVGVISVDMGDTACKVPFAPDYIRKAHAKGAAGKKRKAARC